MVRVAVLDDYLNVVSTLPYWAALDGRARVDVFHDAASSEDALVDRLSGCAIVMPIRERTRFPRSLLARLTDVRFLALTGRNSGHVDLAAASEHGILVAETEVSGPGAVEQTMALVLAVAKRIPQEHASMRAGGWQTGLARELSRKTLGILGLGRIGTKTAAFGALLGMRVLAAGFTLTDERAAAAGATRVEIDDLFRQSDVLCVHLRLSERSRGVVTARHLALMKPTAFLVNTARGPLVDEGALVAALRERRIAGAALDVYDVEPLPPSHPLRALDNVVLSPHMGYSSHEAFHLLFSQAVENVDLYLRGQRPNRTLNPEVLAR